MLTELRKTGISVVGDMPWGTHFCHFYENKADLLAVLLPYFQAGLENNEFCMWVVFEPLSEAEVRDALQASVSTIERHLAAGDIEIIPYAQWYLKDGRFDLDQGISSLKRGLAHAVNREYEGLRVNGSEAWLTEKEWAHFSAYEETLNRVIADQRIIVLCMYPLALSSADAIFDVARIHHFAVAKRDGQLDIVETSDLVGTKAEMSQLNEELEQRVIEQAEELAITNEELRSEIADRKSVESEREQLFEQVHVTREQLQLLSRQLLLAQEAERRVIARELHDEIGQLLTGVNLMLTASPHFSAAHARTRMSDAQVQVRQIIERVRSMALNLRPAMLDDLGLVPALVWLFERYTTQTSIAVRFEHRGLEAQRFTSEVETTAYRIVQEALTNVARHAEVREVTVRLWLDSGPLFVVIADQGHGFDPHVPRTTASSGLVGMYERTALLGGFLLIDAALGAGTQVTAVLPNPGSLEASRQERSA